MLDYFTSWEVEHAGNDTNGGCFIIGSTGTDHSQQAAAFTAFTDLVAATTTTITSVAHPFSATDVGNCIHIASGTGWTVGWYYVVSVSVVTATVDRAIATISSTGGTGSLGGALATVDQVTSVNMQLSIAPQVWVKSDAIYSISSMITIDSGGVNQGIATVAGYTTSRGDNGQATLQANVTLSGANVWIARFNGTPSGTVMSNFILDCNSQPFTGAFLFFANFDTLRNILAKDCSNDGFEFANAGTCDRCVTTNVPKAGLATDGRLAAFDCFNVGCYCISCQALGSTTNGAWAFKQWCGGVLINSVAANFSGTTTNAVTCQTQQSDQLFIDGLSIYGFTQDGIQFNESNAIDMRPLLIRNVLISNVGRYCLYQAGSTVFRAPMLISDHVGCNTTGITAFYNAWPVGAGDVTLSASPFTNAVGNDFSLNATAGGGAAAKAAGFPGALTAGTGNIDLGALQSAAGASGAQTVSGYAQ